MPTEPNQDFIPRKIEEPKLSKTLNQFSSLIEETVNYGSNVFNWCFSSLNGGDEHVPIFLSFRHIFELLDSISILIKSSCVDPCKILLRSIFESSLTIEYLLEKDTSQRGMDFMVCYYHELLKFYRRWNPEDQMCKEFRQKLKADEVLKNMKIVEFPDIKKEIEKRLKIFKLPKYSESEKEYESLRKESSGRIKWYSLHDGPRSVQELAECLDRPGFYQILYHQWSPAVHGTDIIKDKISSDESGKVFVSQIRLPTAAQEITLFAVSFALANINIFIDKFIPEKKAESAKWYKDEIRDSYISLLEKNIIEVK